MRLTSAALRATSPSSAMIALTTFSEATTGVSASPSARSRHETGSPSPDLRSAVTLSDPYAPPLASNDALTRALSGPLGSGRESRALWSS